MSKPQLNHNSTQPNISWVRHENDFAYHQGGGFFGRGVKIIFLEGWIVWGGKGFIFLEEKGEKIGRKGEKKSGGVESLFIMGMHKHFFGLGQG